METLPINRLQLYSEAGQVTAAATANVVSAGVGTPGSVRTVQDKPGLHCADTWTRVPTPPPAPGLKTWERNHTSNNEDSKYF